MDNRDVNKLEYKVKTPEENMWLDRKDKYRECFNPL